MQLVFTNESAQESGVSLSNDKFEKIIVDGYFSRSLWLPLKTTKKNEEGWPTDFGLIKTKEKGTLMLVDQNKSDQRLLLLGQVWGGFRGGAGISLKYTTANVVWSTTSSKHCEGCVAFAAVLDKDQQLVAHGHGRRHDVYTVYTNSKGTLLKEVFQGDEFTALIDSKEEFIEL